ncbi:MAG TPA: methylglyoxal synthase [Chthoniobacterales bacterium]|nr:methylglyoxal synthase [Chthoniobacterales bacterium]
MNEIDYPSDELTDDFLHAQADVGECLLDEEGFQYRPTQNEMNDNRKEELAFWALKQRARLIEHELYATEHTADIVAATLHAPVFRFLSGPLGGDQQIGSRIAESKIDVLIFFWDPLALQPHDCDVKALLRLATVYNIPSARASRNAFQ